MSNLQSVIQNQRGSVLVVVIVLVVVGIGLIGGLFLVSQNTSWFSSADSGIDNSASVAEPVAKASVVPNLPKKTPQPSVQSIEQVYQNPFDENNEYQNPFEEGYENPFNGL